MLLPRFKPGWVAPGTYQEELPKRTEELGAPKAALPVIMPNGKPICSATIRAGPGYLEVPLLRHPGDAAEERLWPGPAASASPG